jgi:hypothetical protein
MWTVPYNPADEEAADTGRARLPETDNALGGAPFRGSARVRVRASRRVGIAAQLAVWGVLTLRAAWWWTGRYWWFWALVVVLACLGGAGTH